MNKYIRNKNTLLLLALICLILAIETTVFLSHPKISLNKNSLFQEDIADTSALIPIQKPEHQKGPRTIPDTSSGGSTLTQNKKQGDLELELLGTALGSIKDPIAFIKDLRSQKQGIYKLGSSIREAKVIQIKLGEVVLDINGKKQTLKLSGRAAGWAKTKNNAIVSASEDHIVISRSIILSNPDSIVNALGAIKVKPYYESKQVTGMMIEGIAEGSIIAAAGIKDKDIVTAVNSQKVNSYQKALQIFSKAKNLSEIKVSVLRKGETRNLHYSFAN